MTYCIPIYFNRHETNRPNKFYNNTKYWPLLTYDRFWQDFNCTILQSMHFSKINILHFERSFSYFCKFVQFSYNLTYPFAKSHNLNRYVKIGVVIQSCRSFMYSAEQGIQLEDDLAERYAKYALISKVRYTLIEERTSRGTLIRI